MGMSFKALGTCSKCGTSCPVSVFSSINTGEDPSLKEKVKNGELFTWVCPECGKINLIKYPSLYHDPEERLMLWITDNAEALSKQVEALFANSPELKDYTSRFVDDAGSLIEKIKIFDAGLDDIAMEICKYVTSSELGKDVDLKFFKMDGADNEITLTYPEKGKMEMVTIGFNVYEDSRNIVARNPLLTEKARGFVKIDRSWLLQYFK